MPEVFQRWIISSFSKLLQMLPIFLLDIYFSLVNISIFTMQLYHWIIKRTFYHFYLNFYTQKMNLISNKLDNFHTQAMKQGIWNTISYQSSEKTCLQDELHFAETWNTIKYSLSISKESVEATEQQQQMASKNVFIAFMSSWDRSLSLVSPCHSSFNIYFLNNLKPHILIILEIDHWSWWLLD